jgi:hypothetical protein
MNENPFARRPTATDPAWGRRRSSRLDYTTPVVISGRDAQGQTFREQTVTTTVNLHGARLITRRQILVGMQLALEVPATGSNVKAVCVRAEVQSGSSSSYIAVQLIRPENVWGVENPPADWVLVATEMIGDPLLSLPPHRRSSAMPAAPPAKAPLTSPAATGTHRVPPDLDSKVEDLTEAALKTLEERAHAAVEKAFLEFRRRIENALGVAEKRLAERADQSFADLEAALQTFRSDLGDELDEKRKETLASAERALRERIAAILSSSRAVAGEKPSEAPQSAGKQDG